MQVILPPLDLDSATRAVAQGSNVAASIHNIGRSALVQEKSFLERDNIILLRPCPQPGALSTLEFPSGGDLIGAWLCN